MQEMPSIIHGQCRHPLDVHIIILMLTLYSYGPTFPSRKVLFNAALNISNFERHWSRQSGQKAC